MTTGLTVFCGPMFAGKSTFLLETLMKYGAENCALLKPAMDGRYGKEVVATHTGMKQPAIPIKSFPIIAEHIKYVLLDEVQFMEEPWFNGNLVDNVNNMLARGISVYAAGLDMDAWGVPFNVVANLLAMADHVKKLKSVCHCGEDANMTMLLTSGERVQLGGSDIYAPVCRKHWSIPQG